MAVIYFNGEVVQPSKACLCPADGGLLRGEGLFETLRIYNRRAFRLDDHISRLKNSAAALEVPVPSATDDMSHILQQLLEANDLHDARARITITSSGTSLVTVEPLQPYDPQLYRQGAAVMVTDSRIDEHSPTAGHKTTSYWTNMILLRRARQCGYIDCLRFNTAGHLSEGCVSNVFLVRDKRLLTPPISSGCLPGITRQVVLELAAEQGVDYGEETLTPDDLPRADEIFLTNSLMELLPVTQLDLKCADQSSGDAITIGQGTPGQLTNLLATAFRRAVEAQST